MGKEKEGQHRQRSKTVTRVLERMTQTHPAQALSRSPGNRIHKPTFTTDRANPVSQGTGEYQTHPQSLRKLTAGAK